jgi:thiamine-phosphate pyrophosphorylase
MLNVSLYGLIDPDHTDPADFCTYAHNLVKGGATLLQYRDKKHSTRTCIHYARLLKESVSATHIPLLINDRVDVCLAAHADGVHLGQDDMHPEDARAILGDNAFIGLTVKQKKHIDEAPIHALSYISIGAVFPSTSKNNPTCLGCDGLEELFQHIRNKAPEMPTCAISGINETTLPLILKIGLDGVAVLSALAKSPHVVETTSYLRAFVDSARMGRLSPPSQQALNRS